ncbi:MAG: hypothetical protein Q4E69_05385 [Bacilli bacterium]|nr:hypothetical protein [Bacilli bacterium]
MGRIIDFNLRKGKLTNISLYSISRDEIFTDIINNTNINKVNSHSFSDECKLLELDIKLSKIKDDKYRDRTISILQLVKDYSDKKYLKVSEDSISGLLNGKDYLSLNIKGNNIDYTILNDRQSNYGRLRYFKDKYITNYDDIYESYLYDLNDHSKRRTITNSNDISLYDSLGYVIASKNKTTTNNYDMFIINNEEYATPCKFNNCTTIKINRIGSNILKNIKVEYLNKELNGIIDPDTINEDNYYLGFNYNSNSKSIPLDIYYRDIDYEDYINIKRGR